MKLQEILLLETPIQDVQNELKNIGYNDFKIKSNKTLAVLTDENRTKVINDILKKIPNTTYDETPTSLSSLGTIKHPRGINIVIKPKSRQGLGSAGVCNEYLLAEKIDEAIDKHNVDTIIFQSPNKKYVIKNAIGVKCVGSLVKKRKKADIVIYTREGREHKFSIKKDNAEMWESADSFWKEKALKHINYLKEKNMIKIKQQEGGYFTITPNVAVKATVEEAENVVFGSDILGNGAVIIRTFKDKDFQIDENTLKITCSDIIEHVSDIPKDKQVWFLIRNDKTRAGVIRGIRVLAVYEKRIHPSVLRVEN